MSTIESKTIQVGDYVVIQRQTFTKLHKIRKENDSVQLGKDSVDITDIISKKYNTTFQMNLRSKGKYFLTEVDGTTSIVNDVPVPLSGNDNRNILDDGKSQKLSKDEIDEMRNVSGVSNAIVEKLITNSTTFSSKTEYSQEKYLRKKEKKYYEYIRILKPSILILSEMYFRQDRSKVLGMRIDDLSQILYYANVHSDGNYLIYESGTSGLPVAAMLHRIGAHTQGKLVHMHPGNEPQKQAIQAMAFSEEQLDRYVAVNIYSVVRWYYQKFKKNLPVETQNQVSNDEPTPVKADDDTSSVDFITSTDSLKTDILQQNRVPSSLNIPIVAHTEVSNNEATPTSIDNNVEEAVSGDPATKSEPMDIHILKDVSKDDNTCSIDEPTPAKRPRLEEIIKDTSQTSVPPKLWELDNNKACEILHNKVDALIIIAKEHPTNIVETFLEFVNPSRPIIIFADYIEILSELYLSLKQRSDITALRLTETFMRNIQVLPERTHPHVAMNHGGYILFGYTIGS